MMKLLTLPPLLTKGMYLLMYALFDKFLSYPFASHCSLYLFDISVCADEQDDKPVFEKRPLVWEEDMQLYSKFLERKVNAPVQFCLIFSVEQLCKGGFIWAVGAVYMPSVSHTLSSQQEELKADHMSYVRHHPELRAILADFLQFLLLRKPQDVFSFAREYFAPFSSHRPPGDTFKATRSLR